MSVNKFISILCFFITNIVLITFVANIFQFYKWICVLLISPIISWFVSNAIYVRICVRKVSTTNKTVLITGCDTGFGHQLAKRCDELGFHVLAGCLNPDQNGAQQLKSICSEKLKIVRMDVTKYEDVVNAFDQIKSSGLPLWAVVNNAGISINAPIEWGIDINQINHIFSVNVFGAVRVAKLSLPLLRQTKGRIINISSIAGRMMFPGITFYCMSKHAMRSLSDGLRKEVELFGITVIDVEPVLYQTPISDWTLLKKNFDCIWEQTSEEVQNSYGHSFRKSYEKRTETFLKTTRKQTMEVISTLTDALVLNEPKNSYKCGGLLDLIFTFPLSYLPQIIQQLIIKYGLKNRLLVHLFRGYSTK